MPKNAILIRLQDKKKSLAKISGLWHNESRTIFDPQEMPPPYHTEGAQKIARMAGLICIAIGLITEFGV